MNLSKRRKVGARARGTPEFQQATVYKFWAAWRAAVDEADAVSPQAAMALVVPAVDLGLVDASVADPRWRRAHAIDLHGFSLAVALALMRNELIRSHSGAPGAPGAGPTSAETDAEAGAGRDLVVISGRGRHSASGESIVRRAVLQLMADAGLNANVAEGNDGVLVVPVAELVSWRRRVDATELQAGLGLGLGSLGGGLGVGLSPPP